MSALPPAAKGTIIFIGRSGHACAITLLVFIRPITIEVKKKIFPSLVEMILKNIICVVPDSFVMSVIDYADCLV